MAQERQPTRVEQLWFTPDTIVIRAEDQVFQVSRAVLAARSSVFRDMIAFPQPTGGDTELFDGTPVVRLHDTAEDVTAFLRAIFDSSYFMPPPAPIEFDCVLGILRLAHKYDVSYLYRRALEHVAADGLDPSFRDLIAKTTSGGHLIYPPERRSPATNFSMIAAATEVGATWLLPWMYYSASTFMPDELLPFMDGTLDPHVRKCLDGQIHLLRGTISVNEFLVSSGSALCATAGACSRIRSTMLAELFDSVKKGEALEPLCEWTEAGEHPLGTKGLCASCYDSAQARHMGALSAFWDSIPSVFGLPPWNELHALKTAVMEDEADT
ncbi:hypothetical protein B0H19DRAFT_1073872 [Mycena capillaripes]|nr:hypothetical protein B0H19DRAFT_1073872 [Mycena capillaripes]